ncbi:hypothetical protein F5Y03DRAFT_408736 [Xylaria venustula]|nr:hypothetical protein F5Y03DRAFT_408736 [Xylaria venustula]
MAVQVQHNIPFWQDPVCAVHIVGIMDPGFENYEDQVGMSWNYICFRYFDRVRAPGVMYYVNKESYRGRLSRGPAKHDVAVIRLTLSAEGGYLPGNGAVRRRDVLWIECKPPTHDVPDRWDVAVKEVVVRLGQAHPNRVVYVLFAVGIKWLMFRWDPTVRRTALPLEMLKTNQQGTWTLDTRLHHIPGEKYVRQAGGGRLLVDTTLAHSLNYWDIDDRGVPVHIASLDRLQWYFKMITKNPQQFAGNNDLMYR